MHPALVYLLACWVVAAFGRKHKFGFWGIFFGSILLTPIMGLLLLIGAEKK